MGNLVNMAKSNVTVIDNEIFNDCNIGMAERGLYASLCCLEHMEEDIDIFEFVPDDNDEIQNTLNVLVHENYVIAEFVKGKKVYRINHKSV